MNTSVYYISELMHVCVFYCKCETGAMHTHFGDYIFSCTFEKADVDNHSPVNLNNQNKIRQVISSPKTKIVVKINYLNIVFSPIPQPIQLHCQHLEV